MHMYSMHIHKLTIQVYNIYAHMQTQHTPSYLLSLATTLVLAQTLSWAEFLEPTLRGDATTWQDPGQLFGETVPHAGRLLPIAGTLLPS